MAQYLIVHDSGEGTLVRAVEAKNMKEAAAVLLDDETATIYRLAGPGKTVTARVEQRWLIEVSDA